jgi:hypothetical protein
MIVNESKLKYPIKNGLRNEKNAAKIKNGLRNEKNAAKADNSIYESSKLEIFLHGGLKDELVKLYELPFTNSVPKSQK